MFVTISKILRQIIKQYHSIPNIQLVRYDLPAFFPVTISCTQMFTNYCEDKNSFPNTRLCIQVFGKGGAKRSSPKNVRKYRVHFCKNICEYFVNKKYTTTSVFGTHTKLKIFTQTLHMKSKLKQFLLVVILYFLSERSQRIHRMSAILYITHDESSIFYGSWLAIC